MVRAPFLLGGVVLRALLAARRGWRARAARLRALLNPRSLVDLLRLLAALALISYAYSWLKVALPLLRPDVLDDQGLFRMETVLHFGVNPGRLLQGLFRTRPLEARRRALRGVHLHGDRPGSAGSPRRSRSGTARASRRASRSCGSWGRGSTSRAPCLGPCYVLKDDYTEVRASTPPQSATLDLLFAHYGRVRAFDRRPEGTDLSPYLGVAAMPSLHVAAQAFLMLVARRRSWALFLLFAALTAVTFFTSVVSGWHYAIDGYVALLLAWVAFTAGSRSVPNA